MTKLINEKKQNNNRLEQKANEKRVTFHFARVYTQSASRFRGGRWSRSRAKQNATMMKTLSAAARFGLPGVCIQTGYMITTASFGVGRGHG